jgi:glucose-6-phosphate 1-epimerase
MTLEVENRGPIAFSFEEALHTYLRVGDVRQATIAGLEEASYIDKTDRLERKRLGEQPMRLDGVTDRVFVATRATCTVDDPVLGRRLIVEKSGSATTVVWNPWSEKAAAMADLGADVWPSMLCVETANVADDAVSLASGERHRMITLVSSRMSPALCVTSSP